MPYWDFTTNYSAEPGHTTERRNTFDLYSPHCCFSFPPRTRRELLDIHSRLPHPSPGQPCHCSVQY